MRCKLFGRSGLRVSRLALGTMTFGSDWGWGADNDESRALYEFITRATVTNQFDDLRPRVV